MSKQKITQCISDATISTRLSSVNSILSWTVATVSESSNDKDWSCIAQDSVMFPIEHGLDGSVAEKNTSSRVHSFSICGAEEVENGTYRSSGIEWRQWSPTPLSEFSEQSKVSRSCLVYHDGYKGSKDTLLGISPTSEKFSLSLSPLCRGWKQLGSIFAMKK